MATERAPPRTRSSPPASSNRRLDEQHAIQTGADSAPLVDDAEDDHLSYASYDHDHDDNSQTHVPSVPAIPWNENTFQDSLMSTLGIAVQRELKITICLGCSVVIDPARLRSHISTHLPDHKIPQGYELKLERDFSLTPTAELRIPGRVIPAVPNLPLSPGLFYCPQCGYAAFDQGTVRRHATCGAVQPRQGYAQTYFSRSTFFAVTTPEQPAPEPAVNLLNVLKARYPDPIPSERPTSVPKDSCDANPFLQKEGWATIVDGLKGEDIWAAVRTCHDDLRNLIRPSVKAYLRTANDSLNNPGMRGNCEKIGSYTGYVLLTPAAVAPSPDAFHRSEQSRDPLAQLVPTSFDAYAIVAANFVAFVLNATAGRLPGEIVVPVPPAQAEAAKKYEDSVQRGTGQDALMLQNLLFAVFSQKTRNDDIMFPAFHFMVFYSFRSDGSLDLYNNITRILSTFVYTGRVAILNAVMERADRDVLSFNE